MTIIQTKIIHFKIVDNLSIYHIQHQQGTLYVKATISFEKNDADDSSYYGYYDMQWLPLFSETKPYTITDAVRSKMLAVLANSCYVESEAFALCENYTYDFSDIGIYTIGEIIK